MKVESAFPVLNLLCRTPPRAGRYPDSTDPGWNCDPQSLLLTTALQTLNVEAFQMRGALYAVLEQPKSADGCEKIIVYPHFFCFAEKAGCPVIIDPSFALCGFPGSKWEGWNPLGIVAQLGSASDIPCRFTVGQAPSDDALYCEYMEKGAGRVVWYCGEPTTGSLDEYLANQESAVMDYLESEFQADAELCIRKAPYFLAAVIAGDLSMPINATQRTAWELVLSVKTTHPSPSAGSD